MTQSNEDEEFFSKKARKKIEAKKTMKKLNRRFSLEDKVQRRRSIMRAMLRSLGESLDRHFLSRS